MAVENDVEDKSTSQSGLFGWLAALGAYLSQDRQQEKQFIHCSKCILYENAKGISASLDTSL